MLVNAQSGRAAVQVPAPSVMLDDGEVERRVRLLRPMERTALSVAALAHTHWERADRAAFAEAWERELAEVPAFTDSDLHIVTGLLLPIWKRLPDESMRVYRLQTDAGERVIGRLVSPAWVAQAVSADGVSIAPADAWSAVLDGRTILELQDGLSLRRAKVMGLFRVELCGFTDGMVDRLKAMGLISEIIAWKLRLFVPTGASGPAILAELMERYPLVADRRPARREEAAMPSHAADLARRLARNAEAVCRHYLSNGHREGRYWLVGDVANTPGPQPVRPLERPGPWQGRRRQMDRRRHRRAWRPSGPHRAQPRSRPPARHPRGGTRVPRLAA